MSEFGTREEEGTISALEDVTELDAVPLGAVASMLIPQENDRDEFLEALQAIKRE